MGLFEDLETGLLEAIAMEKGTIPLTERGNMPTKSFYVSDLDQKLVAEFVEIRKKEKITQQQIANITGKNQRAISRMERGEISPSLGFFANAVEAIGYELQLKKK